MRPIPFVVGIVLATAPAFAQDRPIIHAEKGIAGPITVEKELDAQRPIFRDAKGNAVASGQLTYRRLLINGVLWGSQIREFDQNVFDIFQAMSGLHPLENVAVAGAMHAFDIRQEPTTYYHRTGPVGAIFKELRTRKNGADAKAPVAKLGLEAGSELAYALPGQKFTIYETDPALKRLVADTDEYFTYVRDAKKRGVEVELRMGDRRAKLAEDKGRKYALILVDQAELFPVAKELFTREAVRLYLDRLTDDGILALHISNKYLRLEPMVARLAAELNLTARVWNDDNERRGPGKTASSWVVLARKPEHLGGLNVPTGDLLFGRTAKPGAEDRMRVFLDEPLVRGLVAEYLDLWVMGDGKRKHQELNEAADSRAAWLAWLQRKSAATTDPKEREWLGRYAGLIAAHGPAATLQKAMLREHDHVFRRLETRRDVSAWTDAEADVLILLMDPDVQRVRKFLGLPTPIQR